jgi:salicylate hydroxylase
MDILIVGAGIGGLTAAASLLQRGHRVRVLEQSSALGEVGAGIQMSANAVKVLQSLGLQPALEASGVKPEAFEFRRFDSGELLHRIPLGDAHRQRHGAPYYQMHRGDLHAALVQAVRGQDAQSLRLGARVISVQEDGEGTTVTLAGGETLRADLLIGADGIKSAVRPHVLGADQPRFTGQAVWRVLVPVERIAPELRTAVVSTIWCGPGNHGVMYYLRGGTLLNFVGCVARPWEEESWTVSRPWADLDADYAGWHPMVRAVVDAADKDQCFRWALNTRVPALVWSTARVTLLGDAVHATLPYMAQGAAMAIEDAAVLARALELDLPLAQALRVYEQHRAPRTKRVVEESAEMGELYQIDNAEQMRRAFHDRDIARSRNEWLYPYDPLRVDLAAGPALAAGR